jgi:putative salt-induced outer membrane protein YdiY
MQKHILIPLALFALATCGRAGDANQTTGASAIKAAQDNEALIALAAIGNAGNVGDAAQAAGISTNKSSWESSISAGLSLTKGNSDTLLTTVAFKTRKKTGDNEFAFGADGSYGENDSVKNNETLHGVGQFNHLFSDRFYGYLNAEGLHDGIADLQYRFTFSPGAGYYFLKETNTTLAVEAGPGLIFQRLGGVDTTYATLRLAERFEHKLDNGARVWERAEFLPQVNKLGNFLVNAEIGAEAALTKTLSLRVTLQDNFINQPAPGRKSNDVKLISSLVYKF